MNVSLTSALGNLRFEPSFVVFDADEADGGSTSWARRASVSVWPIDNAKDQGYSYLDELRARVASADAAYDGLGANVSVTILDNDDSGVIIASATDLRGADTATDGATLALALAEADAGAGASVAYYLRLRSRVRSLEKKRRGRVARGCTLSLSLVLFSHSAEAPSRRRRARSLSSAPQPGSTVNVTLGGDVRNVTSADAWGADGTVTFSFSPNGSDWSSWRAVTCDRIVDDAYAQGDRVFRVTHAVASADEGFANSSVPAMELTVVDDDSAGTLSNDSLSLFDTPPTQQ